MMDAAFVRIDAAVVASVLAILMIAALRLGWWLGGRASPHRTSSSPWYTASLSLLSLLLAFTVNTSISMQSLRQQDVVLDARAIRDLYSDAGLVNEPLKSNLRGLIREYASVRIELRQ